MPHITSHDKVWSWYGWIEWLVWYSGLREFGAFLVSDKVVGESSKRSNNESVKGNNVNKVGVNFVNYIGDNEAYGLEYNEEDDDLEWCNGDFSRYRKEVEK